MDAYRIRCTLGTPPAVVMTGIMAGCVGLPTGGQIDLPAMVQGRLNVRLLKIDPGAVYREFSEFILGG